MIQYALFSRIPEKIYAKRFYKIMYRVIKGGGMESLAFR